MNLKRFINIVSVGILVSCCIFPTYTIATFNSSNPIDTRNNYAFSLVQRFTYNINKTWNSHHYEIYLPFLIWHNRLTYDNKKISDYNETPWGLGIGKYRFDQNGNWHSIYAMAFADSHNNVQPIVGYGFQKVWRPINIDEFLIGAGFTLSITARNELWYLPLPLPLPIASIEYKQLSIQATYVPGTYNNGNVLFAWIRWQWN